KSLETLEETLRSVDGVSSDLLDRMGAMGMISVFDVEEIGVGTLEQELSMTPELADAVVAAAAARSEIVKKEQEEQARLDAERKAAEFAATDGILGTGGMGAAAAVTPDAAAESRADSILGGN
ncbi:MAG: hypothetical protein ACKOSQ_01270, partial [Planctomycetaceae bacterium]